MIAYYLQIKHAHIALALASGGLFALRGLLVLAGRQHWARRRPLRILSYTVDTALLAAALMLLVVLQLNPFTTAWLAVKLLALVLYIALGYLAIGGTRPLGQRTVLYLAALACFAFVWSVARAHHPAGLFSTLFA